MHPQESITVFEEALYRIEGCILVILPSDWRTVSEEERTLLAKILGSVKLTLDGAAIVTSPIDLKKTAVNFRPAAILCFDPDLRGDFELYAVNRVGNSPVLISERPGLLDDEMKKSLWNALRQLFAL